MISSGDMSNPFSPFGASSLGLANLSYNTINPTFLQPFLPELARKMARYSRDVTTALQLLGTSPGMSYNYSDLESSCYLVINVLVASGYDRLTANSELLSFLERLLYDYYNQASTAVIWPSSTTTHNPILRTFEALAALSELTSSSFLARVLEVFFLNNGPAIADSEPENELQRYCTAIWNSDMRPQVKDECLRLVVRQRPELLKAVRYLRDPSAWPVTRSWRDAGGGSWLRRSSFSPPRRSRSRRRSSMTQPHSSAARAVSRRADLVMELAEQLQDEADRLKKEADQLVYQV